MKGPVKWWKKHTQKIDKIEMYKAQEYTRGCDEASERFKKQIMNMTKTINDLAEQNIEMEIRVRDRSDKRIEHFEKIQARKCVKCQESLEEERTRLTRKQDLLVSELEKVREIISRLFNYGAIISDEYDKILKSTGRVMSHKNVLEKFQEEISDLMNSSSPLLTYDSNDSKEEKYHEQQRPK